MRRRGGIGPLDPIYRVKTVYGSIDVGNTPGVVPVNPVVPPPLLDFVTGMGSPFMLVAVGNWLYIADPGDGVIYSIDKTNPAALGTPNGSGSLNQSAIANLGSSIFVGDGSTFRVYSISTPGSPSSIGSVSSGNNPNTMVASGNRVYQTSVAADRLCNLNVTTPSSPTLTSTLTNSTTLNGAYGIDFSGSHVFIAAQDGDRLTAVNISVPGTMVVADSLNHVDLDGAQDVALNLQYAYVACPTSGKLVVVDKTTPTALSYVTAISIPNIQALTVGGDHAFAITDNGIGDCELIVLDITTPAAPSVIPAATVPSGTMGSVRDIVLDDDVVYVTETSTGAVYAFDVAAFP